LAPGVTSTLPNPTVTYLNPANYTVSAVVSDASGQQVTRSFVVNVRSVPIPPLVVDVSATPVSGPAPLVVGFTLLTSGGVAPLTQSWTFGDGNSSTSSNPSHVYTRAGTDVATVTVRDAAGHSTAQTVSITVGSPIQISAVTSPTTSVAGKIASFSVSATGGTMPYRVEWDFGDGSGAIGTSATHAFAGASNYTVVVTVIDATGASATSSAAISITAASHPPPSTTTTNNGGSSGPLGAISSPWGMLAVGLAVGAIATAGVFWAARPSVRRR
jgi:PKD repeat protein